MYTVYFLFFQVASATATKFGLSRGLLGLQYDKINASESESESELVKFLGRKKYARRRLCVAHALHVRHPFRISEHVCRRLKKTPSFSFSQVDMYVNIK